MRKPQQASGQTLTLSRGSRAAAAPLLRPVLDTRTLRHSRGRTVSGGGAGATAVTATPHHHVHTHGQEQGLQTHGPWAHEGRSSEAPAAPTCREPELPLLQRGRRVGPAFNSSVWKAPHANMSALRLRRGRTEAPGRRQPRKGTPRDGRPCKVRLRRLDAHYPLVTLGSRCPPGRQLPATAHGGRLPPLPSALPVRLCPAAGSRTRTAPGGRRSWAGTCERGPSSLAGQALGAPVLPAVTAPRCGRPTPPPHGE